MGDRRRNFRPRRGFEIDVSSVAIDRGLLAAAGANGVETDAEVMLRVKAGDDSAFEYLVQKYRRPMVNFMYRMAHNAAAAEDSSAGSFSAGVPVACWLRSQRKVHDLVIPDCHESSRQSCSRYAA